MEVKVCYETAELMCFCTIWGSTVVSWEGALCMSVCPSVCLSTLVKATWNMVMVQTEDVMSSVQAVLTKTEPTFSKL